MLQVKLEVAVAVVVGRAEVIELGAIARELRCTERYVYKVLAAARES